MKKLVVILIFLSLNCLNAQSIRMAYISSFNGGGLSYSIRATLMTPSNTISARPFIKLSFGNGDTAIVVSTKSFKVLKN